MSILLDFSQKYGGFELTLAITLVPQTKQMNQVGQPATSKKKSTKVKFHEVYRKALRQTSCFHSETLH